jgi:hypothetical protein
MTSKFKPVISREPFSRLACIMIFSATEKSNNHRAIRFLAPEKMGLEMTESNLNYSFATKSPRLKVLILIYLKISNQLTLLVLSFYSFLSNYLFFSVFESWWQNL